MVTRVQREIPTDAINIMPTHLQQVVHLSSEAVKVGRGDQLAASLGNRTTGLCNNQGSLWVFERSAFFRGQLAAGLDECADRYGDNQGSLYVYV